MKKIHENVEKTDRYVPPLGRGELYLEYHRGTYTSQARNKRNNRKMENALGQLEWLSVLSGLAGGTYQAERMHDCWETVLRDQFHDIIPGSSIHEVYEDTAREYETLWNEVGDMQKEAADVLCRTAEDSWSLMRFADIDCKETVVIPEDRDGIFTDEDGAVLPAQKISEGWLVETEIKPLSASVIRFTRERHRNRTALCPGFGENAAWIRLITESNGKRAEPLPASGIKKQQAGVKRKGQYTAYL